MDITKLNMSISHEIKWTSYIDKYNLEVDFNLSTENRR